MEEENVPINSAQAQALSGYELEHLSRNSQFEIKVNPILMKYPIDDEM